MWAANYDPRAKFGPASGFVREAGVLPRGWQGQEELLSGLRTFPDNGGYTGICERPAPRYKDALGEQPAILTKDDQPPFSSSWLSVEGDNAS